ncbi:hypothetical protein KIS4809_4639 [Bacillus sp. ZZV12-4809]|nr:hypothetical protein KIS4809_4639 [Bacillus sp. ZZV12-4809]
MDITEFNEKLQEANTDAQLRLLLYKTKGQLRSTFHGTAVDTITVKNGYVRYTYVDSNIKGYCKARSLSQYLTFKA